MAQADYQQALDRVAQHLEAADANSQSAAAVTITLMLQQNDIPADLTAIAARLSSLFTESADKAVQRNATAALSTCLECSDTAVAAAIEGKAAERAVQQLSSSSVEDGSSEQQQRQQQQEDAGLQLNLVVLLGALAEASEAAAQAVLDAGGVPQLLGRADPQQAPQLQEAAADALCKLCSSEAKEAAKEAVVAAGGIPRLAALLGSGSGADAAAAAADVTVRALLCLGMLIGGSSERQMELAGTPGAVAAVLRLMRQQDDHDCQQIAVGLFKELAGNSEAKEAIAAALKEQQAVDAAGAKFL